MWSTVTYKTHRLMEWEPCKRMICVYWQAEFREVQSRMLQQTRSRLTNHCLLPLTPSLHPAMPVGKDPEGEIICHSSHTGALAAPRDPTCPTMLPPWPCGRSVACWRWWSRSETGKLQLQLLPPPGEGRVVFRSLQPLVLRLHLKHTVKHVHLFL